MNFRTMLTVIALLVFAAFLMLKLSGTINWSWWIVTMPLWIDAMVLGTVLIGDLVISWILDQLDL